MKHQNVMNEDHDSFEFLNNDSRTYQASLSDVRESSEKFRYRFCVASASIELRIVDGSKLLRLILNRAIAVSQDVTQLIFSVKQ